MNKINILKIISITATACLLGACSSPETKAYNAQAKSSGYQSKIAQERLKLVDDYKKCASKAGEDKAKLESCDSYLKAAEALK